MDSKVQKKGGRRSVLNSQVPVWAVGFEDGIEGWTSQ